MGHMYRSTQNKLKRQTGWYAAYIGHGAYSQYSSRKAYATSLLRIKARG